MSKKKIAYVKFEKFPNPFLYKLEMDDVNVGDFVIVDGDIAKDPKQVVDIKLFDDEELPSNYQKLKKVLSKVSSKTTEPDDQLENELDAFIGMENIKKQIQNMKILAEKHVEHDVLGMNYAFLGNPGTGKTEMARLIGKFLKKYGYLESGHVIEVDRSKLVSCYIGETAIKTKGKIMEAMGGVLFIDEAYTLASNSDKDFGKEAVETILKAMTDYQNKFCVILAGYKKEMDELFKLNPGFKSRITNTFMFNNYSKEELSQIGKKVLDKKNYDIEDDALNAICEYVYSKHNLPAYGNVRDLKTLINNVIISHANRVDNIAEDRLLTIDDFNSYLNDVINESMVDKNPEEKLKSLIGLNSVKLELEDQKIFFSRFKDKRKLCLHIMFTGNPGTGKSEVARLYGKILYKEGILKSDNFVEVTRHDLIGRYVGETTDKTQKIIDSALGGVLFIDEAYSLCNTGIHNDFGQEAIDTLLVALENHRDDFCCIVAGYTDEMSKFIDSNPGLKSRIPTVLEFPDYTYDELKQILLLFAANDGMTIDDDAANLMVDLVWKKSKDKNFGNAREIRSLYEQIIKYQSRRCYYQNIDEYNIILDDVNVYIERNKIEL